MNWVQLMILWPLNDLLVVQIHAKCDIFTLRRIELGEELVNLSLCTL